jgi:hypothetical protein
VSEGVDRALFFAFGFFAGLVFSLFVNLVATAHAHEWYPSICCGGHDCHPVDCDELTELPNGDIRWDTYVFEKFSVQPSRDRTCHVCIHDFGRSKIPQCIFTQQSM